MSKETNKKKKYRIDRTLISSFELWIICLIKEQNASFFIEHVSNNVKSNLFSIHWLRRSSMKISPKNWKFFRTDIIATGRISFALVFSFSLRCFHFSYGGLIPLVNRRETSNFDRISFILEHRSKKWFCSIWIWRFERKWTNGNRIFVIEFSDDRPSSHRTNLESIWRENDRFSFGYRIESSRFKFVSIFSQRKRIDFDSSGVLSGFYCWSIKNEFNIDSTDVNRRENFERIRRCFFVFNKFDQQFVGIPKFVRNSWKLWINNGRFHSW